VSKRNRRIPCETLINVQEHRHSNKKKRIEGIAFYHYKPPCSAKSETNSDGKLEFNTKTAIAKYDLQESCYHIIQTRKIP